MAEGNRTEEPTPKRLRDARLRGEVARSSDLTSAAVLLAVFATLSAVASLALSFFHAFFEMAANTAAGGLGATDGFMSRASRAVSLGLESFGRATALPLGIAFATALFATFVQVGPLFTLKPVLPDLARISPVPALRRIFGKAQLVELAKAFAKIAIVALLAYRAIAVDARSLIVTTRKSAGETAQVWAALLLGFAVKAGCALVAFGLVDLAHRWFQHRARLRMTRDEVRREHREEEGDPHHKAARARLHREILSQATIAAVRRATVVITNPDHVAVAVEWDGAVLDAPRVVARGAGAAARAIRNVAERSGIPVIEFRELARALFGARLWEEVPAPLHVALDVALRRARMTHQPRGLHQDGWFSEPRSGS